jgi:N-dimethylarginine dimethylaminohydrolase
LGYEILKVPETIFFEGQGDLLKTSSMYFFGWGKRSQVESKPYLEEFLGKPVVDFQLINPYYYHLDTCFAPLADDTVMINQRSFMPEGLAKIREIFPNVIETSEQDNTVIGCNLVTVGKNIVVGKGISLALIETLAKFGYKVHEIDTTEYLKGGGSVKCLSLELFD